MNRDPKYKKTYEDCLALFIQANPFLEIDFSHKVSPDDLVENKSYVLVEDRYINPETLCYFFEKVIFQCKKKDRYIDFTLKDTERYDYMFIFRDGNGQTLSTHTSSSEFKRKATSCFASLVDDFTFLQDPLPRNIGSYMFELGMLCIYECSEDFAPCK